jgi:MFS family permease
MPGAIPGATTAVALLLGINLLNYIDRYILAAVEPDVQREFFRGDPNAMAKTGLLPMAFLVTYMLAAPPLGWLADRVSRWLLVGLSVLIWSLATGASGLAASFMGLLVARMFVGIGEAGYGPAAPTLISDYYPERRRGQMLAWFFVAIPVGSALGYILGSVVKQWAGWRPAFYLAMVPGLALGVIALRRRDPTRGGADAVPANASPLPIAPAGAADSATVDGIPYATPIGATRTAGLRDYLALARIHSYVLNNAAMTAMTFAIGGISFWMPKYLEDVRHLGPKAGTLLGPTVALGGLIATPTGGWLGDRLRDRIRGSYFLVSGTGMLIGAPLVLLLTRTPFPLAWGVLLLAIFFLFLNTGPANTALANVTHPSVRASAFALNILIIHLLGDACAPPILGWVADRGGSRGWDWVFVLLAAVMALSGVLWLAGMSRLQSDTEAVQRAVATGMSAAQIQG